MEKNLSINQNQLLALGSLIMLSPALRLYPESAAETAAHAAVFSAPAALPFILGYLYFICRFMDMRKDGEGLAELSLRCMGPGPGRAALIIEGLWLLLYSAFILRSGADRLITTIYPYNSPGVFIIITGLVCGCAALGSPRTLVRAAKMILPFIFGLIILILLFGLISADGEMLMPVTLYDVPGIFISSLAAMDVMGAVIFLSCFFACFSHISNDSFKKCSIRTVAAISFITVLCAAVLGNFGPELTVSLAWPFFSLVRNLSFFHTLERIEALVVALWVFPDFLLVSMLLISAQRCFRLAAGVSFPAYKAEDFLSLKNKRWIIYLCVFTSIILSLIMAPDPLVLELWSKKLIPVINMLFAFLFVPLIYFTGKKKKEI